MLVKLEDMEKKNHKTINESLCLIHLCVTVIEYGKFTSRINITDFSTHMQKQCLRKVSPSVAPPAVPG